MSITEIYFNIVDKLETQPYITDQKTVEFKCDGKEGSVSFNGYFYVEDTGPPYSEDSPLQTRSKHSRYPEWLPIKSELCVRIRDTKETDEYGELKMLEEYYLVVEIYKRVTHYVTDHTSYVENDDGELMKACFFPTNRQTIYFRILYNGRVNFDMIEV